MRPIFLDHNSTSPIEQGALNALLFFSSTADDSRQNYGNASSVHWAGRKLRHVAEDARDALARTLGLEDPEGFFFTSGATESINTALKGACFSAQAEGRPFHLIVTAVEHEAVLETARFLERFGARLTVVPVEKSGALCLERLEEALLGAGKDATTLVSVMAANNETGVRFPLPAVSEMARSRGALLHIDAVQALGKQEEPLDLSPLAPAMVSVSAHKVGGSKGVGALWVRRGTPLTSLLHGGAQERKRRAGTINVAGIASFHAAIDALSRRDVAAIRAQRDWLESEVSRRIDGASIQGMGQPRIANTTNLLFEGVRGEALLLGLDMAGFAVSGGSACSSGSILPSHVLLAMGLSRDAAASAVRVSLGPSNTREELESFLGALEEQVGRIRKSRK